MTEPQPQDEPRSPVARMLLAILRVILTVLIVIDEIARPFYRPLIGVDGVEMRFHNTTLYNSIFRFDDEMIINTHVYGFQGAHAPSLPLRRLSAGALFETYSESFEAVWNLAKPATF